MRGEAGHTEAAPLAIALGSRSLPSVCEALFLPGQGSAGAVPHVGFTLFSGRSPACPPGTSPGVCSFWDGHLRSEGGGGAWPAFPTSLRRWGAAGRAPAGPAGPGPGVRAGPGRPLLPPPSSSSLLPLLLTPSSPTRRVDAGRRSRGRARALGLEPEQLPQEPARGCAEGGRPSPGRDGSLAPRASQALASAVAGKGALGQWSRVFFPHFRPLPWLNVINAPPFKRFWSRESPFRCPPFRTASWMSPNPAEGSAPEGRSAPRLPPGGAGLVPIPVRDVSELLGGAEAALEQMVHRVAKADFGVRVSSVLSYAPGLFSPSPVSEYTRGRMCKFLQGALLEAKTNSS